MHKIIYFLAQCRRIFAKNEIQAARDFINTTNDMHVRTTVTASKLMDTNATLRGLLVEVLEIKNLDNRLKSRIKRGIAS